MNLMKERSLLSLLQKSQSLLKKIRCLGHIFGMDPEITHDEEGRSGLSWVVYAPEGRHLPLPSGLGLLGHLFDRLSDSSDRSCAMLAVALLRAACVPLFR